MLLCIYVVVYPSEKFKLVPLCPPSIALLPPKYILLLFPERSIPPVFWLLVIVKRSLDVLKSKTEFMFTSPAKVEFNDLSKPITLVPPCLICPPTVL